VSFVVVEKLEIFVSTYGRDNDLIMGNLWRFWLEEEEHTIG